MYKPKTHSTIEGEAMDVVRIAGELAAKVQDIIEGKFIGSARTLEVYLDMLGAESDDLVCKVRALETQLSLQFTTRKDAA